MVNEVPLNIDYTLRMAKVGCMYIRLSVGNEEVRGGMYEHVQCCFYHYIYVSVLAPPTTAAPHLLLWEGRGGDSSTGPGPSLHTRRK